MSVVSINNLSKSFDKIRALNDINFDVRENELFGLIGPDGAGKTTLFRILTTLLLPDSGNISILGLDAVKDFKVIRTKLGYMPGRFSLYQDLTVEENLRFFASIFKTTIQENYNLVKSVYSQLEPFKKRQAGKLSGGMKQKLALSCALIHKPELLILDEPTTGVDAVSRKEFWEMLQTLRYEGITVIVSTPYMDEADLCDRVALIQQGSILNIDTPKNIADSFSEKLIAVKSAGKYELLKTLKIYTNCKTVYPFGEYLHFIPLTEDNAIAELKSYLADSGISDAEIKEIQAGIEDSFMSLLRNKNEVR